MHSDSPGEVRRSAVNDSGAKLFFRSLPDWMAFVTRPEFIGGLLSLLIFLTTIQSTVNGSPDPYTTDVGEIQNALPRWGTLHFTGYPQYALMGSLFVTLLRPLGIEPALGASLYSALWGVVCIGLLVALMRRFAIPDPVAIVLSLLFALSTSMWIDSSLAELHTMTLALTLGILLAAIDYYREQRTSSLYWLAFLSGHGFAHQRSVAFMGLGLLVLVLPRWRTILPHWWKLLLLGLTGPLTYIYLPLRAWMGADWLFSAPGTWEGFWTIVLDTKADRIISFPETAAGWVERIGFLNELLAADWPWILLLPGLLALLFLGTRIDWRERAALTLIWLAYYGLSLIIWVGEAGDALLAVKMPVTVMGAVGLGLATHAVWTRRERWGWIMLAVWIGCGAWLYVRHRPVVTAITHDTSARETIALAARAETLPYADEVTLMSLWGDDYWQLAYAQRYEERLPSLNLVDHNANFPEILAGGDRLLTLSRTFYQRPLSWWESSLGTEVQLDAPVPGLVEISTGSEASGTPDRRLDNGVGVDDVTVSWADGNTLWVQLAWVAPEETLADYSVAVHLVSRAPIQSPDDIIAQADRAHPVDGWYPVSSWDAGEVVEDAYALSMPDGVQPAAVRISMYQVLEDGSFANSNWLTYEVPPRIEPADLFEVAVFSTQPASGAAFDIYILNDADDAPQRLTTDPGTDWFPRLSPNGERILYISSRSGRAEIWVMNADGSHQKRLTELGGTDLAEWSPDGSTIAFIVGRDRRNELYLMDDDGANVRTLTQIERSVHSFSWSPDGSQIVFSAREGGDLSSDCCDIFFVNADGTGERRLTQTPYFEWWPQWSPDGTQIVFMSERENNTDIVLMNADGTGRRNLTDHEADDLYPLWTADGEHILFFSSRPRSLRDLFNSEGANYVINRDGSELRRLDDLQGMFIDDLCCYE